MRLWDIGKTRPGKLFLITWGIASLVFIGISIVGAVYREVAGGASLAALVSGALVDLAVVISWWAGRDSQLIARMSWVLLAVVSVLSANILLSAGNTDQDIVMAYEIVVLSFPLGLIWALIAGPLAATFNIPAGTAGTTLVWLMGIAVGYLQWFVLIPAFIKAVRRNQQSSA